MSILKLDYPLADPLTGDDWDKILELVKLTGLRPESINHLDWSGNTLKKGVMLTIGGNVYLTTADEPITGTPSSIVRATPSGSTATLSYIATGLTGVDWNDTYNNYVDVSGNTHLFDEPYFMNLGDITEPKTAIARQALNNYCNALSSKGDIVSGGNITATTGTGVVSCNSVDSAGAVDCVGLDAGSGNIDNAGIVDCASVDSAGAVDCVGLNAGSGSVSCVGVNAGAGDVLCYGIDANHEIKTDSNVVSGGNVTAHSGGLYGGIADIAGRVDADNIVAPNGITTFGTTTVTGQVRGVNILGNNEVRSGFDIVAGENVVCTAGNGNMSSKSLDVTNASTTGTIQSLGGADLGAGLIKEKIITGAFGSGAYELIPHGLDSDKILNVSGNYGIYTGVGSTYPRPIGDASSAVLFFGFYSSGVSNLHIDLTSPSINQPYKILIRYLA